MKGGAALQQAMRRAIAHQQAGRHGPAAAEYRKILRRWPGNLDATALLGLVLTKLDQVDEGLTMMRRAAGQAPGVARLRELLARALVEHELDDEAEIHAAATAQLDPANPAGPLMLGIVAFRRDRLTQAMNHLQNALKRDPRCVEALHFLARCIRGSDPDQAVALLERALEANPKYTKAWLEYGKILNRREPGSAVEAYRRALSLDPESVDAMAGLYVAKRTACDWSPGGDAVLQRFGELLARAEESGGPPPLHPSFCQTLPFSMAQLRRINACHAAHIRSGVQPVQRPPQAPGERIRIGYLSDGFRDFPTAHLTRSLYRHHDRQRFEIFAYSLGPDDGSPFRAAIRDGVDHFVDIRETTNTEAARRIATDSIDILVDLKTFSSGARPEITAMRPAPVQINWLGFPGTWGAAEVADYIMVDRVVAPPDEMAHYAEQPIYLPHCYQPTDDTMQPGPATARADWGLPDDRFVFCSFNQGSKLAPDFFARWMEILQRVPGSVLWHYCKFESVRENLRGEAQRCGVDPGRLIFCDRVDKPVHLARLGLADLFLDCLPYGAHTTASDALWAGLPVLTTPGDTFQGRVAASILQTAGLAELMAPDQAAFVDLAVALAEDRGRLHALRERVAAARRSPMFDTVRFVRGLEDAFAQVWDRHTTGRPTAPIEARDAGAGG